jgi:hypothetical protein
MAAVAVLTPGCPSLPRRSAPARADRTSWRSHRVRGLPTMVRVEIALGLPGCLGSVRPGPSASPRLGPRVVVRCGPLSRRIASKRNLERALLAHGGGAAYAYGVHR